MDSESNLIYNLCKTTQIKNPENPGVSKWVLFGFSRTDQVTLYLALPSKIIFSCNQDYYHNSNIYNRCHYVL